ncbi:hypothetical protein ACLQ2N_02300 [Streptomyces sp. DT224]|uniref:hypothetical protein n=1 Tax=unclassified Streptomyces TaxID=2593676 RepID=UPI0021C792E5|nr:hypothetical protein [Streptomyces sp. or43]
MIAHLQRASSTAGLFSSLYELAERGGHISPRLIAGDGRGAPIELLAESGSLPYLAQALDAPVERLGSRAPERPTWFCSVRSNPQRPDLTDAQWAAVARRLVAVTGVAPDGDPDACRWIALRDQPRQVHVVATLAREDGILHNAYRDAFHLETECHRIAAELGHLSTSVHPESPAQETHVPAPSIITAEPSGSVSAKGDTNDHAATLLKHAGFQQIEDWYGRRHRLPTAVPRALRPATATYAAQLLRAAGFGVDLDPSLDTTRETAQAYPLGPYTAGAEILRLTDQIRSAVNGEELRTAVEHLHPEHGALERVREALEVTGEQIQDLDSEAYHLARRFDYASEYVRDAQSELVDSGAALLQVGVASQEQAETRTQSAAVPDHQSAALTTSPAAARAKDSSTLSTGAVNAGAITPPSQAPAPRTR